jgi:hypothetical protein
MLAPYLDSGSYFAIAAQVMPKGSGTILGENLAAALAAFMIPSVQATKIVTSSETPR